MTFLRWCGRYGGAHSLPAGFDPDVHLFCLEWVLGLRPRPARVRDVDDVVAWLRAHRLEHLEPGARSAWAAWSAGR
jgi:hypothetical protein